MPLHHLQDIPATAAANFDNDDLEDILAALDGVGDGDSANAEPERATEDAQSSAALVPPPALRAPYTLPTAPRLTLEPRPYQDEAVAAWLRARGRGIVVLPTGAGKTVVAFDAIARLGVRTLVVVPTIELLRQWRGGIQERLSLPAELVGAVGAASAHLARSPSLPTIPPRC